MEQITCDRCGTRIVAHEHDEELVWCSIQKSPTNVCEAGAGGHLPEVVVGRVRATAADFEHALIRLKFGDSYSDVARFTGIPRDVLRRCFPAYVCTIAEDQR